MPTSSSILSSPTKIMCIVCNKPIPKARLDALVFLGTPINRYTHTACSQVSKIKGIYSGEVGTSRIILCDKLYNDSVHSVFKNAEAVQEDNDKEESD